MKTLAEVLAVIGILGTAVVLGTDMFFLTIGAPALRRASLAAGNEVMGFFHRFADARMPIWGASAIVSNLALTVLQEPERRWFYAASFIALLLFLAVYAVWSKPTNRLLTVAAESGNPIANGRELQASWDKALRFRIPLLMIALVAQCIALMLP